SRPAPFATQRTEPPARRTRPAEVLADALWAPVREQHHRADELPALPGGTLRALLLLGPRTAPLHGRRRSAVRHLRLPRHHVRHLLRRHQRDSRPRRVSADRQGVRRGRKRLPCPEKDAVGKCIPAPVNTAPVCNYINRQKLIPGADLISTFSFDCAAEEPIGVTKCGAGTYAGCMTAPCQETDAEGTVECRCPLFDGPFEVGKDGQKCSLTDPPGVWSAAHNVSSSGSGQEAVTFPTLDVSTCTPDLPEDHGGRPLLPARPPPAPPTRLGLRPGLRRVHAVPTAGDPGRLHVRRGALHAHLHQQRSRDDACGGLGNCDTTSIIQLETEMGCSCCASQICRCAANAGAQAEIAELDPEQRDRGVTPRWALSGALRRRPAV